MRPQHLLILRFSAMGDVAMTVPVVYALAKTYPDVRITVCSQPYALAFFKDLAPNVGFMAADIKGEYHGYMGLRKLYSRLLAKQPTALADLHDVLRTKYLRQRFALSGYKCAHINKHRSGKRMLCRYPRKVLVQQPTSFQNYADVFKKLGFPVDVEFTSLFPPEGGNLSLVSEAIGKKQEGEQWIGIAPFAAHAPKQYPAERIEKLIALLASRYPSARIFLFGGGQKEMKQLDAWAAKYPRCINASANLAGLPQELIVMSHLNVMVSMDSANMHLASLVHTPVVSIWGATHPYTGFLGWNQREDDAVQVDLPCRPCSIYGKKSCQRGDLACLYGISPEMIAAKMEKYLK